MSNTSAPIEIIAGATMHGLGHKIYERLAAQSAQPTDCVSQTLVSYTPLKDTVFANGEYKPKICETIRQKDVYYIHGMQQPDPNTALVQLALTCDAISRASARSLTLVLPYMSYTRQDRKDEPRVPISAKTVANILQLSPKLERIITLDMHCDQLQGFYEIPVDNLYGSSSHAQYLHTQIINTGRSIADIVVVSPDFGGTTRARRFAQALGPNVPVYSFDKRRSGPNKVEELRYVGENIAGKTAILYDDIIDTGGSVIKAAHKLLDLGVTDVRIYATHGVFSGDAQKSFAAAGFPVVVTESIPRPAEFVQANKNWLTVLPLDDLLSQAIKESSTVGGSVSKLFPAKAA